MEANSEQLRAIMHGAPNYMVWGKVSRKWVGAPIPDYIIGLTVNWMAYYANPPHMDVMLSDFPDWDKKYVQEGAHFRAYHPDGWLSQLTQSGPFKDREVERHKGYALKKDGSTDWSKPIREIEIVPNCGPKEGGFGGAEYQLDMVDGRVFTLRGPWHTSPPPSYTDVGTHCRLPNKSGGRAISHDLLYSLIRKYHPELDIFLVSEYNGKMISLQPAMPHWGYPKSVVLEKAKAAGRNAYKEWASILGISDQYGDYKP